MKKITMFVISLGIVCVFGVAAFGDEIHVPGEYLTIQAGIDAANNGDTVLVANGVYTGEGNKNVDFGGKAITVMSENGPEYSIIDCEENGRGFFFHSGESESAVVSGFTITHGKTQSAGSGIRCENASSPTISNCNIRDNIRVGLYCVSNSSPTIVNCTISAHTGSGILCNSSSPTIMNCNIIGNSSHLGGGGIDCENASSPTIKDCIIAENDGYRAGGIACSGGSSPMISDCTISNNSARGYEGGGIKCVDSSPTITRCIINGNQAGPNENGGGILARNSSAIISDCTISNNTASHGGGIQVNGGSPTITNCVISGNEAGGKGGGINVNNGSPTITNCVISANKANSSLRGGGGMYIRNASAIITNCTISNNTANEGGGIYCYKQLSQSVPTVTNCIFWEDTPNEIHNSCGDNFTVTYSDVQGGYSGEGNIDDAPLFVGGGDYHLTGGSPCIDTGTSVNAPDNDIDGDARPYDSGFDIGADEYVGEGEFVDVPPGYWAEEFIYKIYEAGITGGCSQNPLMYCPEDEVTRAQMAVFLLVSRYGSDYIPPAATGIFDDVPAGSSFADWIEQLYNEGITGGCSQDPLLYCPENPVTRAQMAVFLLSSKYGSDYTPPPATGIFDDVPAGSSFADWIEQLYNEGITGGCSQDPLLYCPESSVTRASMAVFLVVTFEL